MAKYKILLELSEGSFEEENEIFDTKEEAEEYAGYLGGCYSVGAETLNLSNSGDYPLDDFEDLNYEIVEVEE